MSSSVEASPALACRDLVVDLGGRRVLDGLSATFAPREVTVIVGPNGAGKSTWVSTLAGLRRPDSGAVALGEADMHRLAPALRARRIGVLPQTPEIAWAVDVQTLVGLGRIPHAGAPGGADADRLAVADAIARCKLEPFVHRPVNTLSGGERARALIARALAGEPDWLLADEPLTGLDPGHMLDAAELFRDLADRGRGVILTLHDLAFAARLADRIIVLGPGGRVLSDGAPLDALRPEVLAEAYGVRARLDISADGPVLTIAGRV